MSSNGEKNDLVVILKRHGRPRKKTEVQLVGVDPARVWEVMGSTEPGRLEEAVVSQLNQYFTQLDGSQPHPLYNLVVTAVERPLLVYTMTLCRNNQCDAAKLLGINRNTLHKKLKYHGLL